MPRDTNMQPYSSTLKCIWTTNHPQQNKLINYPYAIYAIFRKFISMLMYRTILFRPMCFWTTNHPQQNKQITYPHAIYAIVRMYVFFSCRCIKHFSGQCNGRPCQSFLFSFLFLSSFPIRTKPSKPSRVWVICLCVFLMF